jgi:hypothetical protein
MARRLTEKQRAFAREFLACRSETEAYIRAYNPKQAKRKTIQSRAWETRHNPLVKAEIERLRPQFEQAAMVEASRIVAELELIAFNDPWPLLHGIESVEHLCELPEHIRRCIKSVVVRDDGFIKIDLHDKEKALDMLARYKGLYRDEQTDQLPTVICKLTGVKP